MTIVKQEILIITGFGHHERKKSKYGRIIKKVRLGRRILCARPKSKYKRKMTMCMKGDYTRDTKKQRGEGQQESELQCVALEQKLNPDIFSFAQSLKK